MAPAPGAAVGLKLFVAIKRISVAAEDVTELESFAEEVSAAEARLLLQALARVKQRRFGRLSVTVSDGRIVDVEIVEKVDRNVLKSF